MAEIGFAVNLEGEIYSPKPYDSPGARAFRDENDRFLSNRENVEVYASSLAFNALNVAPAQKAATQVDLKQADNLKEAKVEPPVNRPPTSIDSLTSSALHATVSKDELDKDAAGTFRAKKVEDAQDAEAKVSTTASSDSSGATALQPQARASEKLKGGAAESELAGQVRSTVAPAAAVAQAPAAPTSSAATGMATGLPGGAASSGNLPDAPVLTLAAPKAKVAPRMAALTPDFAPSANSVPLDVGDTVLGKGGAQTNTTRNVVPQKMLASQSAAMSNSVPEESDFRRVIGTQTSGELARFLENKLRLLVWSHPAADAPIVFGAQLDPGKLVEALKASFQIPELAPDSSSLRTTRSDYCVAILDDTGHPVALSQTGFVGDWKHPFVATEIGEALPHWEAALYLVDPNQISHAARTLQFTLGLIVLVLVAAIVSGGSLIAADVRRQVRLAQQKTDFVSNVSHELKTPLTSIRMFAELLAEKRVPDEERQATYLRIIAAEASRLTRLINNVLDFARLERGAPPGEHRDCDLVDAVRDVGETCGPHLEAAGVTFRLEIEAQPLPIRGDRDALAQIILNLISNAEKYGGNDVLVRVRRQETSAGALGCVDVLDRGAGIPAKAVKTIFEPFQRLDDSLSSGIPGSGLGLTLARRMARSHGGDVTYSARAGGGSCFTLSVPLT
jgi:signal transduction histidine kinase